MSRKDRDLDDVHDYEEHLKFHATLSDEQIKDQIRDREERGKKTTYLRRTAKSRGLDI